MCGSRASIRRRSRWRKLCDAGVLEGPDGCPPRPHRRCDPDPGVAARLAGLSRRAVAAPLNKLSAERARILALTTSSDLVDLPPIQIDARLRDEGVEALRGSEMDSCPHFGNGGNSPEHTWLGDGGALSTLCSMGLSGPPKWWPRQLKLRQIRVPENGWSRR